VSDLIRMIGAFLPDAFALWVNAYARGPAKFLLSTSVVVVLMLLGSALAGKITDEMRTIWKSDLASNQSSITHRLSYGLRTSRPYQWLLSTLKWGIVPASFAAAILYLGLAFTSHLIFNFQDTGGSICRGSQTIRNLAQGEISPQIPFATKDICAATGIRVEQGANYVITVKPLTPWRDGNIATGPQGFYTSGLPLIQSAAMIAAWPLKRSYIRPWFRVVARVGPTGYYETFLDPDPQAESDDPLVEPFKPEKTGELFFYVNDAVIAWPWLSDIFYRNNSGEAAIMIKRR
jgi:hypothetical protein